MPKIKTGFQYKELNIPMDVYIENRSGLRVAFGRDKINVRIPATLNLQMQKKQLEAAKEWVIKTLEKKPKLKDQFTDKEYNNQNIVVMNKGYSIKLKTENRKNGSIKYIGDTLYIKIPSDLKAISKRLLTQKLVAKIMSSIYKSFIENEVRALNTKFFNKEINSISLKYNKSNWGSCSSKLNINLSSRLLLVPSEVREYVIIHELCHLTEMNHSEKFWKLVANACPNYKKHELWLDTKGMSIDF